jgi:hypothetical protein
MDPSIRRKRITAAVWGFLLGPVVLRGVVLLVLRDFDGLKTFPEEPLITWTTAGWSIAGCVIGASLFELADFVALKRLLAFGFCPGYNGGYTFVAREFHAIFERGSNTAAWIYLIAVITGTVVGAGYYAEDRVMGALGGGEAGWVLAWLCLATMRAISQVNVENLSIMLMLAGVGFLALSMPYTARYALGNSGELSGAYAALFVVGALMTAGGFILRRH